ncbi:MAG: exonuclease SbcCD subunit D [Lactobacillus sp.]|jgi:exonuclease SbcD|uniref:Nuclease SbcCD subunit D n=1 Tax=Lacticaseibacillus suilingensis TaxID=2799577 RepID=A0ABW4BEH3_9LACO|nr:exonuclease SbcCD subunit D [Lacticaseibacillus suilingensis]MCI1893816.1 exonuclease SbcCD subunit D [Lactobacillus sp.]MCI1941677.1 exonuclease SbcCD subunit D [Lactobacillus sp.]MCI1972223.1 exonuclease SbcCD subunit D [Lactobacillus sp.]MCI2016907.1 exonuclease SbcCD subunit D [Lactobacillus sp.]MCI2036765.1 exonuclease SbcCD subunit D [Lactobacillus sp.]
MRIMHTADWHIGKRLNAFDLQDDQAAVFERLVKVAQEQQVDAIMIAGDLYDRALPNETAVTMVNGMLHRLNRELGYPLLVISGNHDSAVRLGTGREWYDATQLYLNTELAQAFTPVELGDVQFFLLPYFEPVAARLYFHDDSLTNINKAMHRVAAALEEKFDPAKKHVLIAHFFAAGSKHSESETLVNVGGLDAVSVDDLQAFDYVALGHLHNRKALNEPKVQYSGSLLKYSVSEVTQEKGVYILDTDTMNRHFISLAPLHEVQQLTGSFKEFSDSDHFSAAERDAYTAITLTDVEVIPNVMASLRQVFPRIIELKREQHVQLETATQTNVKLGPMPLLADFYQQVTGSELTPEQETWAKAALAEASRSELGQE